MIMAVVLFVAAIICSYNGIWWAGVLCIFCAIGCAADTSERERHNRRMTQLRRRQLDEYADRQRYKH